MKTTSHPVRCFNPSRYLSALVVIVSIFLVGVNTAHSQFDVIIMDNLYNYSCDTCLSTGVNYIETFYLADFPGCPVMVEYTVSTCSDGVHIHLGHVYPDYSAAGCQALHDSCDPSLIGNRAFDNVAAVLKQAYESISLKIHHDTYPDSTNPNSKCPNGIKTFRGYFGACNRMDTVTVTDSIWVVNITTDSCVARYVCAGAILPASTGSIMADPCYRYVPNLPVTYLPSPPNVPYTPLPAGWQAYYSPCPDTGGHWKYKKHKVTHIVPCSEGCCIEQISICWKTVNGVIVQDKTITYTVSQNFSQICPYPGVGAPLDQCRPFCEQASATQKKHPDEGMKRLTNGRKDNTIPEVKR